MIQLSRSVTMSAAEFFLGYFVAPVAERALSEFLNVALVHQGYDAPLILYGVNDGCAHQALGASRGDRLDAHARIPANLLRTARQHVVVQKLQELFHFRRARFPFDPGVHVFGIFTVDHDVHALGMPHRRRHAGEVAHRPHAGVEIQNLPQTQRLTSVSRRRQVSSAVP